MQVIVLNKLRPLMQAQLDWLVNNANKPRWQRERYNLARKLAAGLTPLTESTSDVEYHSAPDSLHFETYSKAEE